MPADLRPAILDLALLSRTLSLRLLRVLCGSSFPSVCPTKSRSISQTPNQQQSVPGSRFGVRSFVLGSHIARQFKPKHRLCGSSVNRPPRYPPPLLTIAPKRQWLHSPQSSHLQISPCDSLPSLPKRRQASFFAPVTRHPAPGPNQDCLYAETALVRCAR